LRDVFVRQRGQIQPTGVRVSSDAPRRRVFAPCPSVDQVHVRVSGPIERARTRLRADRRRRKGLRAGPSLAAAWSVGPTRSIDWSPSSIRQTAAYDVRPSLGRESLVAFFV